MSTRGVPLTRIYLVSAVCALFAIGYGAANLKPPPGMGLLIGWGPALAVAWWLAEDSRAMRIMAAHDAGLFFYLTWPLSLPWYAVRSRGRAGLALAIQLYSLALVGPLGILWGHLLRFLVAS